MQNVRKAIGKAGLDYAEERIREDFAAGGELASNYWINYLLEFNPKLILDESRWTMGALKKDSAEIIIRYKKSDRDAVLKMVREEGAWKVGLEETFSTGRY